MRCALPALFSLALLGCAGSSDPEETDLDPTDDTDEHVVVPLSTSLCDDPSTMELLLGQMGQSDPPYGTQNVEQFQRMVAEPTRGPFYMVNLIRYRELAEYEDGRATTLTGREANELYSPIDFLTAIGARVVYTGPVGATLGGSDAWDDVAIVEYPCPIALFAMSADPEFQSRAVHKDAGVEASIVMVTHPAEFEAIAPEDTPYPATAEDPSFDVVEVVRLADEEAMDTYDAAVGAAAARVGIATQTHLAVQGVFIGDERTWHEVRVRSVPSGAALEAWMADPEVANAARVRAVAVAEESSVAVQPFLSTLP